MNYYKKLPAAPGWGRTLSSFSSTGVVLGVLASDRQSFAMAQTAITSNIHQPLNVHLYFGAQRSFHLKIGADDSSDSVGLFIGQGVSANIRVDSSFLAYLLSVRISNAENIGQCDDNTLILRNIYTCYSCQVTAPSYEIVKLKGKNDKNTTLVSAYVSCFYR